MNTVFTVMVGAALMVAAQPARAQLRVCNKSNEAVSIAVAYQGADQAAGEMTTSGWYVAKPGECPTLLGKPLERRYYFVRAEGTKGTVWDGDYSKCVTPDRFSYSGTGDCARSGFLSRSFFRIDTGDFRSFTQNLTLASGPGSQGSENRDGVAALRVGWRWSTLDDGTQVMRLVNEFPTQVNVTLKCFAINGRAKTLQISVPGKGFGEVGFLQGWPQNFVYGERCEAYADGQFVWEVKVPSAPTP